MDRLLINRCIRKEDGKKKLRIEDFFESICRRFYNIRNKDNIRNKSRNARSKKITLPSKSDIIELHNFLKQKREIAYNSLKNEFSYDGFHLQKQH